MISDKRLKNTKDLKTLPVVKITWRDACSHHGWATFEATRKEGLSECQTVGFLTAKTKTHLNVVQGISDGGRLAEDWVIPRNSVVRIQVLK